MKIVQPFSIVGRIVSVNRELDIALKDNSFYISPVSEADDLLAEFFLTWCFSKDIKEDLLPAIDAVLSGEKPYTEIGGEIMGVVYIKPEITKLLSDHNNEIRELPTVEFKDIILQWALFLENHKR